MSFVMLMKNKLSGLKRIYLGADEEEYPRLFSSDFRCHVSPSEANKWSALGLIPVQIIDVSIDQLFVQFRSEWCFQKPTKNPKSYEPLPVKSSPLIAFLKQYQLIGKEVLDDGNFLDSSFCKVWQMNDSIGYRYDWYNYPNKIRKRFPLHVIKRKAILFIELYESIKNNGYCGKGYSRRMIAVLEEPFENTRFGFEHELNNGFEVWSGNHRAAVLASLGVKKIKVILFKDYSVVT